MIPVYIHLFRDVWSHQRVWRLRILFSERKYTFECIIFLWSWAFMKTQQQNASRDSWTVAPFCRLRIQVCHSTGMSRFLQRELVLKSNMGETPLFAFRSSQRVAGKRRSKSCSQVWTKSRVAAWENAWTDVHHSMQQAMAGVYIYISICSLSMISEANATWIQWGKVTFWTWGRPCWWGYFSLGTSEGDLRHISNKLIEIDSHGPFRAHTWVKFKLFSLPFSKFSTSSC